MSAKLYPDQSAAYVEQQVFEERHEASQDRLLSAPPLTPYQCLTDNARALLAVCERAAAGFEFTGREYDPETGDPLPPADQTVPYEVAVEMAAVVRAAKGEI